MNKDIKNLLAAAQQVVLYGASTGGARVYFNLLEIGVQPGQISFYDSNTTKHGGAFLDRPILTKAQFDALQRDVLILISSVVFYEIVPILEGLRFTNSHYVHELIFSRKQFEKFDKRFTEIVGKITYRGMNDDEFYSLYSSMRALKDVPGAVAEVGVYKGGSGFLMASVSYGKSIYLFDTFSGLPENTLSKIDKGLHGKEPSSGWLSNTDAETVRKLVLSSGISPEKLHMKVGFFPDTAAGLENEAFSLVHLDTDLYQTTIDALNFFYPRLSRGGRIISHDYNASGCPGVRKAFDELFAGMGRSDLLIEISESQIMGIKS